MTDSATGVQMLNLPSSALHAMHRAALHDRSPAEAAALVRQVGFETGQDFLDAFGHWLEQGQDTPADPALLAPDEFWSQLSGFFSDAGWGHLHFEQLHAGVAALTSTEWAEADGHGHTRQPSCHFTTGMLADLLSRLVGSDLAVLEVDCRSRGDADCRFLLGGADALGAIFEGLRQGQGVDAAVQDLA